MSKKSHIKAPSASLPANNNSTQQARQAAMRVLIPFLLAAALGLGPRLYDTYRATGDLAEVAVAIADRVLISPPDPDQIRPRQQDPLGKEESRLVQIVEDQWRNISERNYRWWMDSWKSSLFPGAYVTLLDPCDSPHDPRTKAFCYKTYQFLLRKAWVFAGIQAILVLLFPALFVTSFFRAAHEIGDYHDSGHRPSFSRDVRYRRNLAMLAEQLESSFFWRRVGFALLIVLGCTYLLSPLGLKASIVGDYLAMNSLPGETSLPLLLTEFKRAPAFTVGFAGFFLYSLTVFVRRFATHDLNDRIFLPLFLRGITVLLLALLLSSLDDQSVVSRALIFAVGIFPQAGLQAIAKMTQTTVDRISKENGLGFSAIPEIDFWKETTLEELGINDYNDLAKADLEELLLEVGLNPLLLVRATDRALLVHTLGISMAQKLEAIPLFTASELILYTHGPDVCSSPPAVDMPPWRLRPLTPAEQQERKKSVEQVLGAKDLCLQIEKLALDSNVRFVLDNRLRYGEL
jgi:hypothetical protein